MRDAHPPASRNTDPITSYEAEHEMSKYGRLSQQQAILFLVKMFPNSTSLELAEKSKLDRYQIARRLADLEHSGKVLKGRIRHCSASGNCRRAVTWRLKNEKPEQRKLF